MVALLGILKKLGDFVILECGLISVLLLAGIMIDCQCLG